MTCKTIHPATIKWPTSKKAPLRPHKGGSDGTSRDEQDLLLQNKTDPKATTGSAIIRKNTPTGPPNSYPWALLVAFIFDAVGLVLLLLRRRWHRCSYSHCSVVRPVPEGYRLRSTRLSVLNYERVLRKNRNSKRNAECGIPEWFVTLKEVLLPWFGSGMRIWHFLYPSSRHATMELVSPSRFWTFSSYYLSSGTAELSSNVKVVWSVEIQLSECTRAPQVLKHNLKLNSERNLERTPLQIDNTQ